MHRHPLHNILLQAIRVDAEQMVEEGHDLAGLHSEIDAVADSADALLSLQQDFWSRSSPPDFPYEEPNDWETITAGFPDAGEHAVFTGTEAGLRDRLLAAWQGRCVGCQLGKPLEGTTEPDKIKRVLQTVGSWPLTDYMNAVPDGLDVGPLQDCDFFGRPEKSALTRGNFDHVAPDDDIHYAIVGLSTLERHGAAFTTEQAVRTLHDLAPVSGLYSSGKQMFVNALTGFAPPYTALFSNVCRQSLGAMIRCDPWGWTAPGNPALAADMAYRDAVGSQVRNGIYSGVFFSVLMADTLAHGDPIRAIATAQAYVPPRSRFAEMIRVVRDTCYRVDDWEEANRIILSQPWAITRRFNHALLNGAIALMGLLKGGGDFTRTLGITVMAGLDTDCTGATVGSIMGCALGTAGIPDDWTAPLNDTVRCELKGICEVRISDLAERTFRLARNVLWRG